MRTIIFRILSLLLVAIPLSASAQSNIEKAFEAIVNCKDAKITPLHSLSRDPNTNVKNSQSDIYDFVLPENKINLIRDVEKAFEKDEPKCYGFYSGKTKNNGDWIKFAIGDGTGSIRINDPKTDYIYAYFLATSDEDKEGIYRYAYGMSFKKEDDKIIGKLVKTYATTLKYRQSLSNSSYQSNKKSANKERKKIAHKINKSWTTSGTPIVVNSYNTDNKGLIETQSSWLDLVMGQLQSMPKAQAQTKISLAKEAYKYIRDRKKYPEVTDSDIKVVREVLTRMLNDNNYSEPIVHSLLKQCLENLR